MTTERFGKAVQTIMSERGLTETALAAKTPYNQGTISRYIHSKRGRQLNRQTHQTMCDIARGLDLDPEYFLEVRIYRAWQEVAQDMRDGLITLEALRMLREGARLQREAESLAACE